ncbi:MAG TPA: protein-L-isoaspartate(D-aspartate) O-methyltransferase [Planctomycetota bacterium]|nr:protein-L-isoaspartate(D-aspartate) O-methyltransferase [Planctomycetota bacterium]
MTDPYEATRESMVTGQLERRGIRDLRVLEAFRRVPRDRFVCQSDVHRAHEDHPLAIGCGQTISQPYMVALMTQCLELAGREVVLEIGTGSGYQTAILCELAKYVYSIERIQALSERAGDTLRSLGYTNVELRVGDGTLGWPEHAPFDRIIVTAAAPDVPGSLRDQLVDGGILVIPVGPTGLQTLQVLRKHAGRTESESVCDCVFVKLIGEEGYDESS